MTNNQLKLISLEDLRKGSFITGCPGVAYFNLLNIEQLIKRKVMMSEHSLIYIGHSNETFETPPEIDYKYQGVLSLNPNFEIINTYLKHDCINAFFNQEQINEDDLLQIISTLKDSWDNEHKLYIYIDKMTQKYYNIIENFGHLDFLIFVIKDKYTICKNAVLIDEALYNTVFKYSHDDTDEEALTEEYLDYMYDDYDYLSSYFLIGNKKVIIRECSSI